MKRTTDAVVVFVMMIGTWMASTTAPRFQCQAFSSNPTRMRQMIPQQRPQEYIGPDVSVSPSSLPRPLKAHRSPLDDATDVVDDDTTVDRLPDRNMEAPAPTMFIDRREMLVSMAAVASVLIPMTAFKATAAATAAAPPTKALEDLQFGHGSWTPMAEKQKESVLATKTPLVPNYDGVLVPASFATYLTRFLINYDEGVASWWRQLERSYSLLSAEQRQSRLGRDFGNLAASLQQALTEFLMQNDTVITIMQQSTQSRQQQRYEQIFERFVTTYTTTTTTTFTSDEVRRQLCLLAAILPPNVQPRETMKRIMDKQTTTFPSLRTTTTTNIQSSMEQLATDLSLLLATDCYTCQESKAADGSWTIQPPIALYQVGLGGEFGQAATATAFGPLASTALTRERPQFGFDIYALFGICGATGCALTHSLVVPLDVVKTKAQTSPEEYSNILVGAQKILDDEGVSGLLTGAQATLAGYFWYGLSVYPSYAFFKRFLSRSLLPIDVAVAHANDIALVAGALAAVVASLGLTPLEAARIRVVADPQRYKPLGLVGTLQVIAEEGRSQATLDKTHAAHHDGKNGLDYQDRMASMQSLYAGLPSLMTRQVIFGSLKFLAFERACETIFNQWPFLRDATWTTLAVSLVAGGFSGALSSFVSQPADSVLTYVAAQESSTTVTAGTRSREGVASTALRAKSEGGGLGVLEGCRLMIEESGPSSLFRGLGSRSLWAAAIIAGQFLLYDVFRTFFGINSNDLSQVFQVDI